MCQLLSFRRLRRSLIGLTVVALFLQSIGCGTFLHPERRGQPPGRIDPAVVLLDGLCLLLFFVPGVIAFAVDFTTGAIYLPPDYYGQAEPGPFDPEKCEVIHVPPSELTREKLETILAERTGRPVKLEPGTYQVRPLEGQETENIKVLGQSE